MSIVLTVVLALHGAFHLLGYLKWSGLATIPALSGRLLVSLSGMGERAFAMAWLAGACLLLVAAAFKAARQDGWWIPASLGVLLSQGLIIVAWPDAKAGTVANLVILVPIVVAAAHTRFARRTGDEAAALLAHAAGDTRLVTRDELRPLPPPVARWLETAGVVGRPRAATVRLRQRGEIRTKPNAPWMPALARQAFSIDPPGFVWTVDAMMMRVVPITGRDRYVEGHGQMLIKAASLVNVANAADEGIDAGSMLRYLAEIIWFPSAALGPYVSWEPVDSTHARATIRYGARATAALFTFDESGRPLRFDATRPLGGGKEAKLTPWFGVNSEWRTCDGIEVPVRGEVGWRLPTGPFVYYRWQILDLEVNPGGASRTAPAGRASARAATHVAEERL